MGNKASGKNKKDPTLLTDEDMKILKVNTHYTDEEIQAWHSGFLKDCPSGKLDKKQFLNVYKVRERAEEKKPNLSFEFFFFNRNFIRREKRINIATLSSKHSIRTIIIGLILPNSCKCARAREKFFISIENFHS